MAVVRRRSAKRVRRSVSLSTEVDRQVNAIAKHRRVSNTRVLAELIEQGIEVAKEKERALFETAERLRAERDPEQIKRQGDQLGRLIFGE